MTRNKGFVLFVFAVVLLVLATACNAAGGASESVAANEARADSKEELEATLIETEKKKWDTSGEENFLTMANSYADDFINIGLYPTGAMRQNKKEAFEALAKVPPPAEGPPPELSDFLVVHPDEGSAIVTYKVTAPWATYYATSVYAERDGTWQTVFYQATDAAVPEAMAQPDSAPEAEVVMPESDILVTFADGTCTREGLQTLSPGSLSVALQAEDLDMAGYSVSFLTLEPGKTLQDLIDHSAVPNASNPGWVNELGLQWVRPGESQITLMPVTSGPVYMVCFSWDESDTRNMIGYEGPIEVNG